MSYKLTEITRILGYYHGDKPVNELLRFRYKKNTSQWTSVLIILYTEDETLGDALYFARDYRDFQPCNKIHPGENWWLTPPQTTLDELFQQALKTPGLVIPERKPGVAWLMFTNDGRLVTELRSWVDNKGKPIRHPGKLNLPSGGPEASDEGPITTVWREFREEHHNSLYVGEAQQISSLYDPELGQMIVSFKVIPTYEEVHLRQENYPASRVLKNILDTEGLANPLFYREDLLAAMDSGAFIPQVAHFFRHHPEYLPQSRLD